MRKKIGQMRMDKIQNKTEDPVTSLRHSPKYQEIFRKANWKIQCQTLTFLVASGINHADIFYRKLPPRLILGVLWMK